MRGDLTIRKVRTASGATAIQIVRYVNRKCVVVRHMGSVKTEEELKILWNEAEIIREELCDQPSLFPAKHVETKVLHENHLSLQSVTHLFAHKMLRQCNQICGLGDLHPLYQDLALMRIIEPASKLRTIELLKRYFSISYAQRTVYRLLPQLITHKPDIERTACLTCP